MMEDSPHQTSSKTICLATQVQSYFWPFGEEEIGGHQKDLSSEVRDPLSQNPASTEMSWPSEFINLRL